AESAPAQREQRSGKAQQNEHGRWRQKPVRDQVGHRRRLAPLPHRGLAANSEKGTGSATLRPSLLLRNKSAVALRMRKSYLGHHQTDLILSSVAAKPRRVT